MNNKNDQAKAKEIWVPCKFINEDGTLEEYPNYEVSNFGRVRSLNYNKTGKIKVMKPGHKVQSHGTYYEVQLCRDKKPYWRTVHRLVLSSFNSKGYFECAIVDHVNSNTEDNRLKNLRWLTVQDNNSTLHCKESTSKSMTNHPSLSKRVKATFLDDNHTKVFPSTHEAERALGLSCVVSSCILNRNGFYKKLNVLFEYV